MTKYLVMTGGSRGIGEKAIERFLAEGWQAINIARSSCRLPGVKNFNVDLFSHENIQSHAQALKSALNNATLISLVHNAASYKRDTVDSLSFENLNRTLEINVLSPIALNQILIPLMPETSSIIYIGTTLSEKGVPGNASYIISKHAVVGLMRATCQDLIEKKIRSLCICPGLVDTALLKETMDKKTIEFLLETKIIGKRLIAPEEIANVIYFCATNAVMNGTVVHANLGHVAE